MMRTVSALALLACLAACGSERAEFGEPRSVDKDNRSVVWNAGTAERLGVDGMGAPRAGGSAMGSARSSGGLQVVADTPAGWQRLDKTSQFRQASWQVEGAPDTDCYLTVGVGGGLAMNLSRWYQQQFGNAETPGVDALPQVEFADRVGRLAEIEGSFGGKPDWAALIAFYEQDGAVTSLKFTGPATVVKANKEPFLSLAASIRLASASPDPAAPPIGSTDTIPEGHPDIGGGQQPAGHPATGAVPGAGDGPFRAEIPEGWREKGGSRRFLHHTFGERSEVYVGTIGGTLKQSLDIWRSEVQKPPMSDAEFAALPNTLFLGDDAVLMDVAGDFRSMSGTQVDGARLLVAARQDGATITYCKLVGPAAEVDAQRDAFVRFCGSVRRTQ